MDNASLIEQCSAGSKEAMESLYCRYSRRMMRVIHRYVHDAKCAEDILHDGFVLIFTHIAEVRQPERLEFWMGTIMKNLCLNYLSNLDVMTMLDDDVELPEIPELEEILSYEELEQLINRLPDGYRTVFKLAVLEGKSHKEIGRLLGISPNTSSSQLFHAKALLRKLIIERRKEVGLILLSLLIVLGAFMALRKHDGAFPPALDREASLTASDKNSDNIVYALAEEQIGTEAEVAAERPMQAVTVAVEAPTAVVDTAARVSEVEEPSIAAEAPADTLAVPSSRREEPARQTVFDIPRKAIAKAGWTVGARYSVGTRTPSLSPSYYLDNSLWDNASGSNMGTLHFPEPEPWPSPSFYHETDYDLPMTFGLTVARQLTRRLSFETGVCYTFMRATQRYTSLSMSRTVKSSFVGIPVKFDYTLYSRSRFSLYATAGASVDFPVGRQEKISGQLKYPVSHELPELKSRTEFSVHGGLGLQYLLNSHVGLYVEPSVRHYIKNNATSPSYWQEHRTLVSLPVGIRINW